MTGARADEGHARPRAFRSRSVPGGACGSTNRILRPFSRWLCMRLRRRLLHAGAESLSATVYGGPAFAAATASACADDAPMQGSVSKPQPKPSTPHRASISELEGGHPPQPGPRPSLPTTPRLTHDLTHIEASTSTSFRSRTFALKFVLGLQPVSSSVVRGSLLTNSRTQADTSEMWLVLEVPPRGCGRPRC